MASSLSVRCVHEEARKKRFIYYIYIYIYRVVYAQVSAYGRGFTGIGPWGIRWRSWGRLKGKEYRTGYSCFSFSKLNGEIL